MNVMSHSSLLAPGQVGAATSIRWAAIGEAGVVVAMLAGLEAERPNRQVRNLPANLRDCEVWQRDLAVGGIDDLAVVMETGLAALLAVRARGADCRAAALALWREFIGSRDRLMALVPPAGILGPMRSA